MVKDDEMNEDSIPVVQGQARKQKKMPRYIDAEKVESVLYGITAYKNTIPLDSAIFNIRRVPTADVVEVVRRKDCKHHKDEEPGMVYCPHIVARWVSNDFFCANGKRRDDETN